MFVCTVLALSSLGVSILALYKFTFTLLDDDDDDAGVFPAQPDKEKPVQVRRG